MQNVPPCFLVSLLLPLLSGVFLGTAPKAQQLQNTPSNIGPRVLEGPMPANGVYFDCEVVEHLNLTKEGYKPFPAAELEGARHLTIDWRSGEVRSRYFDLEWERIRVVKAYPDYNIYMTRGYSRDGTPANEVVLERDLDHAIHFVSLDLLTSLDVLDGTCK
jgi:hypothetical protein